MKKAVLFVMFLLTAQKAQAFQCNECHSKNPAMVRMHKALQGRGCFDWEPFHSSPHADDKIAACFGQKTANLP